MKFEVSDGFEGSEKISLQDAFRRFREKRMEQIFSARTMLGRPSGEMSNAARTELLRSKFLSQALKYLGVPYARKYHEEGSPDYDAPLYLDCCALVRKVLKDMKNDIGFNIGRWNQAYQFDTLPITIENEEDMKPGDLVFITGTYFNETRKRQIHDMVHVEIWLGEGEKTVGARYHKGRVQIHDSYKFVSKSYHSMQYHFKSIDTWLNGVCRSFCAKHAWRTSKYLNHGKNSIFLKESCDDVLGEPAGDSDDDDDDDEQTRDAKSVIDPDGEPRIEDEGCLTMQTVCNSDCDANFGQKERGKQTDCVQDDNSGVRHDQSDGLNCKHFDVERDFDTKMKVDLYSEDPSGSVLCLENIGDDSQDSELEKDASPIWYDCEDACSSGEEECDCNASMVSTQESRDSSLAEAVIKTSGCTIKSCPSGNDSKQECAKSTKQGDLSSPSGTKQTLNGRPQRPTNKSPSKTPSKQHSIAVSSSFKRRHKAVAKFYIGGKNGVSLVEKPLLDKGWLRIDDNKDLSYYFKWVECKSRIDYKNFRAGEQLVNHIPNGGCLTTKTGLLKSLQEYAKNCTKSARKLDLSEFYPETYKIENKFDFDKFAGMFKDGETWICKPSGLNQGKGIYLVKKPREIQDEMQEEPAARIPRCRTKRVVSRYIQNPLLLNGCKFDIRAYMLIASTVPYLVLYHSGYVRLACAAYSNDSTDLTTHLTNQLVQKKHPEYSEKKDNSVWTFEMLNDYIQMNCKDAKGLVDNWVFTTMTDRIKEIMLICFRAVQCKLERKLGYFDLLGFDFLIDDNMKVWLLEVNVNPALFTNCECLRKVIPDIVKETVTISVEAFENSCKKKNIHPIESLKTFEILFDEGRNLTFGKSNADCDAAGTPEKQRNVGACEASVNSTV